MDDEVNALATIRHRGVCYMLEFVKLRRSAHIVIEYLPGGTLKGMVRRNVHPHRRLGESEARHIFRQLSSALAYMHERRMVHRDVKVDNVMFDRHGNAKLVDLGFTTKANTDTSLKEHCGTLMYAAPEIYDPKAGGYGRPVDVFALGVTLFFMLAGHYPFHTAHVQSAYELWKALQKATLKQPESVGDGAFTLLRGMLTMDAAARTNAEACYRGAWTRLREESVVDGEGEAVVQEEGNVVLLSRAVSPVASPQSPQYGGQAGLDVSVLTPGGLGGTFEGTRAPWDQEAGAGAVVGTAGKGGGGVGGFTVNEEVLDRMVKLGFDRDTVCATMQDGGAGEEGGVRNQISATYFLFAGDVGGVK